MNRTKKQHYVPQFYLKNFANKKDALRRNKSYYETYTWDFNSNKGFSANVEDIAYGKFFYDVTLDKELLTKLDPSLSLLDSGIEDKLAISYEKGFAELEGKMSIAIKNLISYANPMALTMDDRAYISAFCATILLRTPRTLKLIDETMKLLRKEVGKKITTELEEFLNPSTNKTKFAWLRNMDDLIINLSTIICGMEWSLGIAKFGASIHTSDNPLLLYNPYQKTHIISGRNGRGTPGGIGIKNPGIQIFLPLTPYMVLNLTHLQDYGEMPSVYYFDHQNALFIKNLLVNTATRFLFTQDKTILDIREGIRKNAPMMIAKSTKNHIFITSNPNKY